MTSEPVVAAPDVLMVLWQVDRDPWRMVARDGQMATWLRTSTTGHLDGAGGRIVVRHALGLRGGSLAPRIDAWNSRMRWHRVDSVRGANRIMELVLGAAGRNARARRMPDRDWFGQPAWRFGVVDVHMLWRWKFIAAVEAALEMDPTWIFFTTSSSYVRPAALLEAVDAAGARTGVYAGSIAQHRGLRFVSGACRLISSDVARAFLDDASDLGNSRYEDVEFELWAKRHGLVHRPLVGAGTINITSIPEVDALTDSEIVGTAHFRCTSPGPAGRRDDVRVMRRLHERVVGIDATAL